MRKRIMLVDDSRVVYIQMKQLLAESSYEIAEYCSSGEEALEKYATVRPDLVTMDIIMPGMDGLETARILKMNTQKPKSSCFHHWPMRIPTKKLMRLEPKLLSPSP